MSISKTKIFFKEKVVEEITFQDTLKSIVRCGCCVCNVELAFLIKSAVQNTRMDRSEEKIVFVHAEPPWVLQKHHMFL